MNKKNKSSRAGAPQSYQQTTVVHKNKKTYSRKSKHKKNESE